MLENRMVLNTPDAPWNAKDDDGGDRLESLMNFMEDAEGWRQNGSPRRDRNGNVQGAEYLKGPCDYQIIVSLHGWEFNEFTDGDIAGVATGRWRQVDEGQELDELKKALATETERCEEQAEERRERDAQFRLKAIERAAKSLIWGIDQGYLDVWNHHTQQSERPMLIGPSDDRGESAFLSTLREAIK